MPMLLRELAISGSRKSDGTPNASGVVFLYQPGTTSVMTGWKDEALSQAWPTTSGGIQLDAAGRATIWVDGRVDVLVQDAAGGSLQTLAGYADTPANDVVVANAGFAGAITDPATGNVTQGAGGVTDLDTVLSRVANAFGGPDAQYQENTGATPRRLRDVVRAIQVSPQDYGALGNGVHDDTVGVLAAIAELGRLGGGVLYFPPGTYKVSSTIQIGSNAANAIGISVIGAGSGASAISGGSVLVYGTRSRVAGLTMPSIDIENAVGFIGEDIVTTATAVTACRVGSSSQVVLRACKFAAINGNALSVGLMLSESSGVRVFGCQIIGGSSGVGVWGIGTSASGDYSIDGNSFSNCGLAGAVFQASLGTTLTGVSLVNNHSLGSLTTPILALGTTYQGVGALYPTDFVQRGNNVDGLTANVTSGGTVTPLISQGYNFRFKGTTTGSAYTVNAPDAIPSSVIRGTEITIEFVNAAGGAVTGWTLDSIYKTTASIPTTDGHSIQVKFQADPNGSGFGGNWREISRADTTT